MNRLHRACGGACFASAPACLPLLQIMSASVAPVNDSTPRAEGRVAVIVPAAGRGERLGPGAPKALRELAGTPLLVHAVRTLLNTRSVDVVCIAAPPTPEGVAE